MKDAKDYGYKVDTKPNKLCHTMIKNHPERVEATSLSGKYQILAKGNILYLDTLSGDGTGSILKRETLAGDQTDLRDIMNVWIHEKKKRFMVLQKGSPRGLLTYTLEYASNTAPLRHFTSPILNSVTRVKLLDDRDELALISSTNKTIKFVNSDADTILYKGGKFVPKLYREIKGNETELNDPLDVVISDSAKEIYVLDSGKILVFGLPIGASSKPKKIIELPNDLRRAVALELVKDAGYVSVTSANGITAKVSIKH